MGKISYPATRVIDSFDIKPERILAREFEVIEPIGTDRDNTGCQA